MTGGGILATVSARDARLRRASLILAALLCVLALVQAVHKARKGQCALLKWRPEVEALARGESIYGREAGATDEGFPTPPITALCLRPFLALGDVPGAVAWATLKLAASVWMIRAAARMAAGSWRAFPAWASLAVIVLSARVLLSDVAHGNINILLAAIVTAAAWEWREGRELRAGLWIGLASVLKVTPLLFVAYFAWKRSPKALAGALAGIALAAVVVPGLLLGWYQNFVLLEAWWQQMVAPYVSGAPPTIVQTEQINQSLLGVLARWLTESTAIVARPGVFASDVSINVASLSHAALRMVLLAASAAVLAGIAWCARVPGSARASAATLGEVSMVALAMLALNERSWKQHYVTLFLPLTFLAWLAATQRGRIRVLAFAGLVASALLHGLTGSGVLGERASDYAEAYGAWLAGGLALLVACGSATRALTAPRH